MTKEEAIKYGTEWLKDEYLDAKDRAFIKISLEALKQEPCNTDTCKVAKAYMNEWDKPNNSDAIRRQAALDCLTASSLKKSDFILDARDKIKNLPPVNPQEPKTGHWKAKSFHELFCDNCGFDFDIMRNDFIDKMHYCPNCGVKMVEPQEREEV